MASASFKDKTSKRKYPTPKQLANLRPQNTRSKMAQREVARMGGIASGEKRARKKEMAEIYGEFLEKVCDIKLSGTKEKGLVGVVRAILEQSDDHRARVTMLKEIREGRRDSTVDAAAGAKADLDVLSGLMGTASPNETSDDKNEGETK